MLSWGGERGRDSEKGDFTTLWYQILYFQPWDDVHSVLFSAFASIFSSLHADEQRGKVHSSSPHLRACWLKV